MILTTEYDFGDVVYLKTDPEQYARIITGLNIRGANNNVIYLLSYITAETEHFDFEFSKEKEVLKTL